VITDTQNLAENRIIHRFKGSVSNVYILVDNRLEKSFLVDCGMPSDVDALAKALRRMPPLERVVCSHFHVDHVAGWIQLRTIFKSCSIWFHERAQPLLAGLERIPLPAPSDFKKVLIPCMREARYVPSLSDLFSGGLYGTPFRRGFPLDRVKFFGDEQDVLSGFITLHTPGHRPESVSFFDQKSGIIITGDFIIVINGEIADNTFLASPQDQKISLEKIRHMNSIRFVFPGHGVCRPFTGKDLAG
jgi:glyoxylase-like metal-dependent hydrolase (beta-lactamase superfamily II)